MSKTAHLTTAAKNERVVPATVPKAKSASVIGSATRKVRTKVAVSVNGHGGGTRRGRNKSA